MNNHFIVLKVKIQAIYFQTDKNELGISHATKQDNARITVIEAEQILQERAIHYKEILKVKFEDIELEIPMTEYENYLI